MKFLSRETGVLQ